MPKICLFFGLLILFFGCAENHENEITGDFIYIADTAVLKGNDFIYGVELDSMSMLLAKKVAVFKKGDFDMVPVIIEGSLHEKKAGAAGWDTIVKVNKIISVGNGKIRKNSAE